MNLFHIFKRKPESKPVQHYHPEMTADCKGVLSGPVIPDWNIKADDLDDYVAKIGNERRN